MVTVFYAGWEFLAMTAAFLGVIGAALLFMLARLFNLPQLEQGAKAELIFAVSTIFIVSAVVAFVDFFEPQVVTMMKEVYGAYYYPNQRFVFPPGQDTMVDISKLYMAPVVTCAKQALDYIYIFSIPVEAISSVYMEIFMSEHAGGFGAKPISERLKNLTDVLTFYVFAYYVLVHVLNFIKFYWTLFFTIGVLCRAFPFTRGAGAYLMAISLGFYFVFPGTYILVGSVATSLVKSDFYDAPHNACSSPDIPKLTAASNCGMAADPSQISDMVLLFKANKDKMDNFFDIFAPSVLRHITNVVCFIPLIALTLTLTFILSATSLFGGTIPEVGRGLVKLI